jgi:hypothetical protein
VSFHPNQHPTIPPPTLLTPQKGGHPCLNFNPQSDMFIASIFRIILLLLLKDQALELE